MSKQSPAYQFGQLRRALKRYREGKIDIETFTKSVERFLAWDANEIGRE